MVGIFLFVVTSHEDLGDTGNKTGSWLHELAAPYWRFRDAGYDVVIASPKGGMAPLDPTSLEESWISDAGRRFQADEEASADLANTRRLDDIRSEEHTSELQSLMSISYAVFCLKKKKK